MNKLFLFLLMLFSYQSQSQDSLYLQESTIFTEWNGLTGAYSITSLNTNEIIVAYIEGGVWEGRVRLGTIDENCAISFNNHSIFSSEETIDEVEVIRISETTFVLSYRSNIGFFLKAGIIDDTGHVVLGQEFTLLNDYIYDFSSTHIEGNEFLLAYYDPETALGKCGIFSVNQDLSITKESDYFFATSDLPNSTDITVTKLSRHKFVIAYGHQEGYAVVGTIMDDEIVDMTLPFEFSSGATAWISAISLNDSIFIVSYGDRSDSPAAGTSIIGRLNADSEISYSEKYLFNDTGVHDLQSAKLSETEFLISYSSDLMAASDEEGLILKGTLADNQLTFTPNSVITGAIHANSKFPLTRITDDLFVVQYINQNSFNGYVKVGGTSDIESCLITSSQEIDSANFSINPNPISSNMYIQFPQNEQYDLHIFDLNGHLVFTQSNNQGSQTISLSGLENGLYMVNLISKNQFNSKKIIIQK